MAFVVIGGVTEAEAHICVIGGDVLAVVKEFEGWGEYVGWRNNFFFFFFFFLR